ncbi:MAG: hypothetical protein LUQ38_12840 [Methanotrichaceae archaeon]|nr:hypothetical protein [Methanotrichaceae archaeon]
MQGELLNFKVKIDPQTAHDSYSAWRESEHDDLVLSVALACWYAETRPKSHRFAYFNPGQKIICKYRPPGTLPPPAHDSRPGYTYWPGQRFF